MIEIWLVIVMIIFVPPLIFSTLFCCNMVKWKWNSKIIHDLYIEKNITLKINKIYRVYSSYENSWDYYSFPLILTIKNNNIEIVKLLIRYANNYHIR